MNTGGGKKGRKYRNVPTDVFKNINMTGPPDQCWEWKGKLRKGNNGELRPVISVQGVKHYAYRLVWELYNGRSLEHNEVVRHTCDNTKCCNPKHLQVGVQKDNVEDMVKRERVGERIVVVKKIMYLLESGATSEYVTRYMKEKYEVDLDVTTIRRILNRKFYRHIEWPWGDEREARKLARIAGESGSGKIGESDDGV